MDLGHSIHDCGHKQLVARSPSAHRAAIDRRLELGRRHGVRQSDSAGSERCSSVRSSGAAGSKAGYGHPRTLWASRLLRGRGETRSRNIRSIVQGQEGQRPLTISAIPAIRKYSIRPVLARANTRDASRPGPSERVRLLVRPNDAGIARWRPIPPLRSDAKNDPGHAA